MIDSHDIAQAAKLISTSLHRDLKAKRLARIDIDSVRCAVAGWNCAAPFLLTVRQIEELENQTLRKIVEAVG